MSRRCSHCKAAIAAPASTRNLARTSEHMSSHPRTGGASVSWMDFCSLKSLSLSLSLSLRFSLNNPSQGLHNPPRRARLKEHEWTSSLNYVAIRITLSRPLSPHFHPTLNSFPPPVDAQAPWLNARRRPNSPDTPASIWFHSFSNLQEDRDTTPANSSNTLMKTRIIHQTTLHNSISKQQLRAVTT